MDPSQQLHILRDLLAIERANNEQHRQNNLTMKRYLQHLQDDYLKLQSDLVQALEYGHKLKAQKETQINCLETNLKQKDVLIEQLRTQLGNLDEAKLRADLKAALDKQLALHQLEQEQLHQQIATNEQQLCRERVNNSQLLQQFQEKLDDQVRLHEREMETMKSRLVQGQEDLERVLSEPQNLIVKALREDKSRLEGQVDELELALEETRNKYDSLRKRLELLLLEQERVAQQSQEELDKMQQVSADQRRALTELRLELDDKHEIIQVLDFNVERSEKRVKNLLAALKNKEVTYRELIGQTEAKHRLELEKLGDSLQLSEKRFVELESELSAKQNELVRLRLEQENQLESLRNDRDERLAKMAMEKTQLAKEVQAVELKLARECEQSNQRSKLIEQLQKEVQQFREESKRLSIELTKSEAKLYAKQQELQAAQDSLAERDANQVVDLESQSKLATTQRELDDERGHSKRLKTNLDELKRCNEKLQAKLRIAESNLDKTRSAINREHEKMMREYEKKMESIRSEQASFDKNKLRYKRYGFKLKKYCEHLKRVHAHLCTPNNCGYIIEPNAAARNLVSSVGFGLPAATTITRSDSVGLLDSDGDEQCSDSPYYDDIISGDENGYHYPDTNTMPSKPAERTPNRFIIKRTGLSPAISSPILKTKHQQSAATNPISRSQNQCSRVPLRSKSTNLISFEETKARNAPNSCDNSNLLATTNTSKSKQPNCEENSYYNTREESCSVKVTSSSKPETERSRMNKLATSARSRRVVTGTQQKQQKQQQVLRTLI